jgi:hypothetical protein
MGVGMYGFNSWYCARYYDLFAIPLWQAVFPEFPMFHLLSANQNNDTSLMLRARGTENIRHAFCCEV